MSVHDNKVAIITGGAQGIGRGVVDVLASEGAKVCIADISEEHGKAAVETIKQSGGSAMFVKADFQKSEVPKMVVDRSGLPTLASILGTRSQSSKDFVFLFSVISSSAPPSI